MTLGLRSSRTYGRNCASVYNCFLSHVLMKRAILFLSCLVASILNGPAHAAEQPSVRLRGGSQVWSNSSGISGVPILLDIIGERGIFWKSGNLTVFDALGNPVLGPDGKPLDFWLTQRTGARDVVREMSYNSETPEIGGIQYWYLPQTEQIPASASSYSVSLSFYSDIKNGVTGSVSFAGAVAHGPYLYTDPIVRGCPDLSNEAVVVHRLSAKKKDWVPDRKSGACLKRSPGVYRYGSKSGPWDLFIVPNP
jgi:hypothetical protein